VLVTFTLAFPFLLVPLVGLAIDGTMLYSVKAKLQTAVDGASIAAALNLSSGINFAVQEPAAELTAKQFIAANIGITPAQTTGYWGSNTLNDSDCDVNGTPSTVHTKNCVIAAEDNANKRRTVTVAASVKVPLLFMRVLGFSNATVAAKGQAARRDVVLVLVIDRSSSMVDQIGTVRDSATFFVNQFQSARDKLGLVVFGGSAIIAYPSTDWLKDTTNPATVLSGPDTNFKTTPDSAAVPNMLTSLSNIQSSSNTGTADALMLAYKELVAANQPGALNVIVLFTDGKPNGITAYLNNYNGGYVKNAVNPGTGAGSPCAWPRDPVPTVPQVIPQHPMKGWMAQWGNYVSGGAADGHGFYTLAQTDNVTYTSVTDWLVAAANARTTGGENVLLDTANSSPSHGCSFATVNGAAPNYHSEKISIDAVIPTTDIYGNPTQGMTNGKYTTNDYKQSEIWSSGSECNNGHRAAGLILSMSNDACQIGLASWNAADMAARQIRLDPTGLKPVIYSMGYQGNGGVDQILMERLSNINVAENTVYNNDPTFPQGMYLPIATVNDIAPAFQKVLSEILRIAM
jgi:Flp pilus assembly protein TadG